jgi:DNA-binding NtrC family response regulator
VRELRNVIRRAILLASDVIEPEHLSVLPVDPSPSPATALREPAAVGSALADSLVDFSLKEIAEAAAADAERRAIHRVLQTTRGNKSEAARHLRTDYKTLHLKMKQYGIDAGPFREFRAP